MRIWPRSLLGRSVLLLVGLVLVSQICAATIFVVFIQTPRIDEAAELVASQILLVNRLLPSIPEAERRRQLVTSVEVPDSTMTLAQMNLRRPSAFQLHRFFAKLMAQLPPDIEIRLENGGQHRVWVRLRTGGQYYWVVSPVASTANYLVPWSAAYLVLTFTLLPMLGAYLIHRRIVGPLQQLAHAASSIERGAWPEPVPVAGPIELATVTEAFNRMMNALAEVEATRTEMLAGISHDIRTPLTKLRMAIAAPETLDAPQASAERFIEEIDLIVQQFIDFARGSDNEEALSGDLNALIEQLAGDYAGLGHPFELALAPLPPCIFRPVGVQRLLMNLMQNAVLYGRAGLAVRSWAEEKWVVVAIEDAGPGVPMALLPLLKQPFRRGLPSDHQKGGSGLGLAIAEGIARQHGGSLDLHLRERGGLAVVVKLPYR